MSVKTPSDDAAFATVGVDAPDLDGVDAIVLDDDDVLIYDRNDEDAWIQSDDYIDLGTMI